MIKPTKIFYINSFSDGSHHEMFNSAILYCLLDYFPVIEVYSGRSSWEIIKGKLDLEEKDIKLHYLCIPLGKGKLINLFRYLIGAFYNILVLMRTPADALLIYNFNNAFSLKYVNFLNKFLNREIIIFCHGEMELLTNDEGGILAKLLKRRIRNFFLKRRILYARFCVLGDNIIENLKPLIREKIDKFISIDHPYFFVDDIKKGRKRDRGKLLLATVGELNKFKGEDAYVSLIEKMRDYGINSKFRFSVIGIIENKYEVFKRLGVEVSQCNKFLSREEFDKKVQDVDYILFFYGRDKYRVTASGALFDAIKWQKPIIAIENSYFRYLFNKYGKIGYLFNSVENMAEFLKEEKFENNFDFENYVINLSPANIAEQLYYKIIEV